MLNENSPIIRPIAFRGGLRRGRKKRENETKRDETRRDERRQKRRDETRRDERTWERRERRDEGGTNTLQRGREGGPKKTSSWLAIAGGGQLETRREGFQLVANFQVRNRRGDERARLDLGQER